MRGRRLGTASWRGRACWRAATGTGGAAATSMPPWPGQFSRAPAGRGAGPRAASEREVVVDRQRRMVAEARLGVDVLLARERGDARRGEVVVEAPAHVLRPGLAAVAPPRVLLLLVVQGAEHVDQAAVGQQLRHPLALLGQEAGVLLVALPVLEVDVLVRDVDVAHQDELALGLERHQVRVDQVEEAELGGLALLAGRAAREVAADDAQLLERVLEAGRGL